MLLYQSYTEHLEKLVSNGDSASTDEWKQHCHNALNGGPTSALLNVAEIALRRNSGIFFTGDELAGKVLKRIRPRNQELVFFDPACGVGNLLLAVAKRLPIDPSLIKTLKRWGPMFMGIDKYEAFARSTRARLALLALSKGASPAALTASDLEQLLPNIKQGDGLSYSSLYRNTNWILLNPPYSGIEAPESCDWANGNVTAAALFIETAISLSAPGTRISAILPDVLRSGSRYLRWRKMVESKSTIHRVQLSGLFDRDTDINVFILDLTVTKKSPTRTGASWNQVKTDTKLRTVKEFFNVHVGPVVPHRDLQDGASHAYIHAKALPKWTSVRTISEVRCYAGRVFTPPFVVVRRTSRPGDQKRAVATIINCASEVAVENHLVVLLPRDKKLSTCKELLRRLKLEKTDNWLNKRIRCRHLTVEAVKEIPWMEQI